MIRISQLVFIFFGVLFPQIVAAGYQFSNYDFVRNPARVDSTMRIEMRGRPALRSYRFVGRVGGVNFEGIVDLSDFNVDLDYDPSREDGQRATATLNGDTYILPLFDWELEPIVAYSDTKYTAVVSIFGDGPDEANYRYIDYHPAFLDTHLGMRLVQADILLMDPITFSEAPSDGSEPIYFPGEQQESSSEQRSVLAFEVAELLDEPYQAWVLTDTDVSYNLRSNSGFLRIETTPYFYFWKSDTSSFEETLAEYEKLRGELLPAATRYEALLELYQNGSTTVIPELNQLQSFLEPEFEKLEGLSSTLDNFEPEIVEVESLTAKVVQNYDKLHDLAPFVFEAVDKTAQFSAFFRGAKQANSGDWVQFKSDVLNSIDLQFVETPNQFLR